MSVDSSKRKADVIDIDDDIEQSNQKRVRTTEDESSNQSNNQSDDQSLLSQARINDSAASFALTSMPANEDDLYSHYVEQRITKQAINEGTRSCILETCYPPFWDETKDALLMTRNELNQSVHPEDQASNDQSQNPDSNMSDNQTTNPTTKPAFKPAKVYPFTLDPFQSQSIASLERGQSVLVSAHTSAGKTVVAEYAIAMALRDKQRVIYTSPIKALSNQKYRELYEEFNDVGLMTGDITINPSASCLVMTTEILRNMLYRGSEVVREVSTIVYDEIHYMRNKERGVVWEETIILVPHSVRFVFLSATIPNASEFACWIAKLHHQPVNVVYTDYRPTPLQHYLFPAGGDGLYLVVDEKGSFREDNFQKALAVMKEDEATAAVGLHDEKGKGKKRKPQKKGEASDIYKIVKMCLERAYQPVIIFSFSKRECERHAQAMAKIDFSDVEERQLIDTIFSNAIESLSDDDKQLPQVTNILPILRRGIGIHHSGLLPLLKEVIEILFQEGLLKCLFSTETFSMGLNMPAKTVVFTSVRKWDGAEFRIVTSGEYIQMSGRAGRRGLDDRGVVICMLEEAIEPTIAKSMLKGESDTLNSSFHLGYNMLLNLLRVEDQNPMKLMARSFMQFQSTRKTPLIQANVQQVAAELAAKQASFLNFENVKQCAQIQDGLAEVESKMRSLWRQPKYVSSFLQPGRLAQVAIKAKDLVYSYDWCIILHCQNKPVNKAVASTKGEQPEITVLVYAQPSTQTNKPNGKRMPNSKPEILVPVKRDVQGGQWQRMIIELKDIQALSSARMVLEKNLNNPAVLNQLVINLERALKDMKQTPPLLDPKADMKVTEPAYDQLSSEQMSLKKRQKEHVWTDKDGQTITLSADEQAQELEKYCEVEQLEKKLAALIEERRRCAGDAAMLEILGQMQAVLRRLGHTNPQTNVIDVKGRVAAEISTADELVAAELMLNGQLNDLSVEVCVALCSCFVMNEKADDDTSSMRPELKSAYELLVDTARRIGDIQIECKLDLNIEDYLARFSPSLMEVVYQWCKGAKFAAVMKLTDVFEGTIIRCMRRLEELLRQFSVAALSVGNAMLAEKFTQGITLIKRDIVFAASLYL